MVLIWPLPGTVTASMVSNSPPTSVQARPVTAPIWSSSSPMPWRKRRTPEKSATLSGGELDLLGLALEDLAQRLARDLGDLALERAHARLAGIMADQGAQAVLGEGQLALLEAVRLDLLRDQVAGRDLDLLVLGIAFEPDDLHAVEQRLRHVHRVRGGDEHDVRKIVVDLQIMVLELRILLRVEHLEQGRGGIAAEILAELVDLVEQEERVGGPGLPEVGDDLAGQRADIGAPVAANLGFVADAAQ